MNYKVILEHLGLVEGIDFELTQTSFTMKVKQRQVMNQETFELEIQEYVEAEPTLGQLQIAEKELQIAAVDYHKVIAEYLKGKEALLDENDSYNVAKNRLHSWSFVTIPQPTVDQLVALIPSATNKVSKDNKLKQILELEAQITPRKVREALLQNNYSFIQNIELQIQAIRETL